MRDGEVGGEPRPWVLVVPAVVSLLVGLRLGQPSVFPDESGAILNARAIIGAGPASPWWYLPGYGALLVPVAVVTESPSGWVRGIQIVNAGLLAVAAFGLVATLRSIVPRSSATNRQWSAALSLLTPSSLYFAGFAIADNALIALAAWLAPATSWLQSARRSVAVGAGFTGAALAATVHSRSIVFPVAIAVALAWGLPRAEWSLRAGALLSGAVIGRVGSARLIDSDGGSALSGTGRQSLSSLIGDNLSIDAMATLPGTLWGQLFAVTIATMGVAVIGVMALARSSSTLRRAAPPAVAIGFALVASLASSVLFTNGGTGDFALYARYVEVAAPPLLALGWLALWERSIIPHPSIALAVLASGPALVVLRGADAFDGRLQRLNVAGLAPFIRAGDGLDPFWLGLLAASALFVVGLAARRSPALAAVLVVAVSAVAVVDNVEASRDFIGVAGGEPAVASLLDPESCVSLDQSGLDDFWFQENLRLHRLDVAMPFWAVGDEGPPCLDAVLSSRPDVGAELPGWDPVAVEPGRVQWLWMPRDRSEGPSFPLLVGASLGAPLVGPSGAIDMAVRNTSQEEIVVQLAVKNTSSVAFVPAANLPGGLGGIQVGLEWRSPDAPQDRVMEPVRVALPGIVPPGGEVTTTASIERAADAGTTVLRAELVQEGVGWFETISASTTVEADR